VLTVWRARGARFGRIKRIGFGFRRFAHYRLRVLLYAGRPNWNLIDTIDPLKSDEPINEPPTVGSVA
jgi:hypothetical protein